MTTLSERALAIADDIDAGRSHEEVQPVLRGLVALTTPTEDAEKVAQQICESFFRDPDDDISACIDRLISMIAQALTTFAASRVAVAVEEALKKRDEADDGVK